MDKRSEHFGWKLYRSYSRFNGWGFVRWWSKYGRWLPPAQFNQVQTAIIDRDQSSNV